MDMDNFIEIILKKNYNIDFINDLYYIDYFLNENIKDTIKI